MYTEPKNGSGNSELRDDTQNAPTNGASKPAVKNGVSAQPNKPPLTIPAIQAMKDKKEKIVMITAYDSSTAQKVDEAGVDVVLVGDSLGMVVQGHDSTLPVSADDILYHCRAVRRGLRRPLLIADMPFRSSLSVAEAIAAAASFVADGGAQMVKLEGSTPLCLQIIEALTERHIPVCAHLGLTPQAVHELGGYRLQGKSSAMAEAIADGAKAVEKAGAKLLVLECVPEGLAERVSVEVGIPVIGIGAGAKCDGQVLVIHDLIGLTSGRKPKFSKNFLSGRDSIHDAIAAYVQDVRAGEFPAYEHTFH